MKRHSGKSCFVAACRTKSFNVLLVYLHIRKHHIIFNVLPNNNMRNICDKAHVLYIFFVSVRNANCGPNSFHTCSAWLNLLAYLKMMQILKKSVRNCFQAPYRWFPQDRHIVLLLPAMRPVQVAVDIFIHVSASLHFVFYNFYLRYIYK